jgi:hypothetical protein
MTPAWIMNLVGRLRLWCWLRRSPLGGDEIARLLVAHRSWLNSRTRWLH